LKEAERDVTEASAGAKVGRDSMSSTLSLRSPPGFRPVGPVPFTSRFGPPLPPAEAEEEEEEEELGVREGR
jgi:hypothetical protein